MQGRYRRQGRPCKRGRVSKGTGRGPGTAAPSDGQQADQPAAKATSGAAAEGKRPGGLRRREATGSVRRSAAVEWTCVNEW